MRGVFKQIGGILVLMSGVMTLPLLVSLAYQEYYTVLGLAATSLITLTIGFSLFKGIGNAPELTNKHCGLAEPGPCRSISLLPDGPLYTSL